MEKTEVPGFFRAGEGIIVNKDSESLKAYKMKKQKDARLNNMEHKISKLESDISEIKDLLKGLVK